MHEADHSCPSSMKTEFRYTSASPNAFVACADQVYLRIRGVNGYTTAFFWLCFSFMLELKTMRRPARPRPTALLPPRSNGKPEAATAVIELLMMGMRMPETC